MGGESLGTYSIEVDSASSRPCVEVWAMCAGVIVAWSPDSGSVWSKGYKSACDWVEEERKPQTSARQRQSGNLGIHRIWLSRYPID